MYIGGSASPLDELPYEFFSSSLDEVPVRVTLGSPLRLPVDGITLAQY